MATRESERPPADDIINQVIFDKKCGFQNTHDIFYKWCSVAPLNKKVNSKCTGVYGTSGYCDVEAAFLTNENFPKDKLDNFTITTNDTAIPDYPEKYPEYIYIRHVCDMGSPEKDTDWSYTKPLPPNFSKKIVRSCHQEMYGVQGLSLWIILLVVFLVLLAVSLAGSLFWTYWLKKKLRRSGATLSVMGSRLTSAPFSDNGKTNFLTGVSQKKLSRAASEHSRSGSKRAPVGNAVVRSDVSRANAPSLRSAYTTRA